MYKTTQPYWLIRYKYQDADGNWSAEDELASGPHGFAARPEVCEDNAGNAHVFYITENPKGSGVFDIIHAVRTGFRVWSHTNITNSTGTVDDTPVCDKDTQGVLHLVYTRGNDIVYRTYNGTWSGTTTIGYTNNGFYHRPDLAIDPDNNLHVVWGDDNHVYYRKKTTGGGWGATHTLVTSNDFLAYQKIAAKDANSIVATVFAQVGDGQLLYAASTDGGDSWSGQQFLDTGHFPNMQSASGRAYLVYQKVPGSNATMYRKWDGSWGPAEYASNTGAWEVWADVAESTDRRIHVVYDSESTRINHVVRTPEISRPTAHAIALNATSLAADGTREYTCAYTAYDGDGAADITDMRILFNLNFDDKTQARGYLAWGSKPSDITGSGGSWDVYPAEGYGYWGIRTDAYGGRTYIDPFKAVRTYSGNTRTITWHFRVKPQWGYDGPEKDNWIGMWVRDVSDLNNSWEYSSDKFNYTFNVGFVPYSESVSLSSPYLKADDTTIHEVTHTVYDENGAADIDDVRVLFNLDFNNKALGRGYLAWGSTPQSITWSGGTWDIWPCEGYGYYGIRTDDWGGYTYITPVSAVRTVTAKTRTVTWRFKVKPAWASLGPTSGNWIGLYGRDIIHLTEGWQYSDDKFGLTFDVGR